MRRFLGSVLLAFLVVGSCLAAGPAGAAPAESRESSPTIWQALRDLLSSVFAADESDGRPGWDPNGFAAPQPGGGAGEGSSGDPGSGEADGSPGWDTNG